MDLDNQELIQFPIMFSIKVMGANIDHFELLVLGLIQQHAPECTLEFVRMRPSRDGKYLSVTIPFKAESRKQLDAIYQDLSSNERVLMVL